jgi:site-specific DNA recombinase
MQSARVADKMIGGIPLAYGTLAYLLKNRTYLGETGHRGAWFEGEHQAIVERTTFECAQDLMRGNAVVRKHRRSESGALLMDLLFDDRGNRMSPSFSSKKGVRYRFYISSPLLKGDKEKVGSLPRISAPALESTVIAAVRDQPHLQSHAHIPDRELLEAHVERIEIGKTKVRIAFKPGLQHLTPGPDEISAGAGPNAVAHQIELPWSDRPKPRMVKKLKLQERRAVIPIPA